jgi:hypothetical protein
MRSEGAGLSPLQNCEKADFSDYKEEVLDWSWDSIINN